MVIAEPPVELGAVQVAVAVGAAAVPPLVNLGAVGAPGAEIAEVITTAVEVDAVAAVVPANLAVRLWVPAVKVFARVATPEALVLAVPRLVTPS